MASNTDVVKKLYYNMSVFMLIKNPHKPCFFTHAQIRNGRIDSNQILHINSL